MFRHIRRPRPRLEPLEDRCVPAIAAADDAFAISQPQAVLDVLANDTITDNSGLQMLGTSAVAPGGPTLTQNADGTLTLGHATVGTYTFGYTADAVQRRFTPEGAGAPADSFGASVAISGDTAVIGVPGQDVGHNWDQGAVWVFVRSGSAWTEQARLLAPFGTTADIFGGTVAIDGDTLVASSVRHQVGSNLGQGAAFVYVRSGTTWSFQAELTASDGVPSDQLGQSLAISGDTVVAGTVIRQEGANYMQGAVYVFVRAGTAWSEQAKLLASDGQAYDQFSSGLSISGDTVVVGARHDDIGTNVEQGSAYVFVRAGTAWSEQAKLTASDGAARDTFGSVVGISGDTLIVGAALDDVSVKENQGSAYVFVRSGTTWSQQAHLTASDGSIGDLFGGGVAIDGDRILVGAAGDTVDGFPNQGSAYVYERSGTVWSETRHLTVPRSPFQAGVARSVFYGGSVALDGEMSLIGAPGEAVVAGAILSGAAYARNVSTPDTATVTVTVSAWPTEPVLATGATANLFQVAGSADWADNEVAAWYRGVLGREPDAVGLSYWAGQLRAGVDPRTVLSGIWYSEEHRLGQVASYYQQFLGGRAPDAEGLRNWTNAFLAGADEDDVIRGFVLSQEYANLHAGDDAFVAALFDDLLGRTATPGDVAEWTNLMASSGYDREAVFYGFLDSRERRMAALSNLYASFLLRSLDESGVAAWLTKVESGRMDVDEVALAVLGSPEFAIYAGNGP